jgi:hypothetical protein
MRNLVLSVCVAVLLALPFVPAANGQSIILTVAGGGSRPDCGDGEWATNLALPLVYGLAVDSSANLYLAGGNGCIFKVTAATGIDTEVRQVSAPFAVALDSSGENVYIAEFSDGYPLPPINSVVKVNLATFTVTTVGGNAEAGYSGDGGPATSAELNVPVAVAVDSSGNVFVADLYNYRIREITSQSQTAEPTFTPGAGTYTEGQTVVVSDVAPGATIYCSTGNALPFLTPANICKNPIEVNGQTTLNAVATLPGVNPPGYNKSYEVSEAYSFNVAEVNFVNEVPSASGASMTVYLADATPDATIYYSTDGALPVVGAADASWYAGPIVVTKPETIKTIGVHAGYQNSSLATKSILLPAAQPVISPGTSVLHAPQTVTITDATGAAPLYCVLNGAPAVPCAASYQVNSREEIQAYAEGGGYDRSVQATAFYTMKVASPTLSLRTGTYPGPLQVRLFDATPGAAIFYTTEGSTPVPGNPNTYLYNNKPVVVSTTETVKVIAVLTGYETSPLEEAAYRIQ